MNRKNKGLVRHIHPPYVVAGKCGGFTLMELLITLAIISLLVGLLLPALSAVRKAAREAKQHAQITTLELAISAFKNDYGDYPPSMWSGQPNKRYCGSQQLSEALLGWDLMGFHPDSQWWPDGHSKDGTYFFYDPSSAVDMEKRKGPYLELATTNAFRLGNSTLGNGLFDTTGLVAPEPFVICDVFGVKKIILATGKTAIAGTPILYYKANTSSKNITDLNFDNRIYSFYDNDQLVLLRRLADWAKPLAQRRPHKLEEPAPSPALVYFYEYIQDLKVTAVPWPYRPDSYILISAGADGFYGTDDDIRNFGD
jgi:prepilin-type N-terminal cleavage/methylation domain-containing protein